MKKTPLFTFFLFLNLTLFAQSTPNSLAGSSWSLQKDQMAGLGAHHTLEIGTVLSFVAADQWTLSQPLSGYGNGHWKVDKKGRTVLYFGEKKRGFCRMEGEQLILIVPGVGKERRMVWARK